MNKYPTPTVGAPATIVFYTDTNAAVVTRVSGASIWVQKVETGEWTTENPGEPWPVRVAEGVLNRPYGPEQRFARHDDTGRHGPQKRGEVYVRVGHSTERRDYRV